MVSFYPYLKWLSIYHLRCRRILFILLLPDVKPNTRPSVNGYDQGFDAIPSNEDEAKSPGKKGSYILMFCVFQANI